MGIRHTRLTQTAVPSQNEADRQHRRQVLLGKLGGRSGGRVQKTNSLVPREQERMSGSTCTVSLATVPLTFKGLLLCGVLIYVTPKKTSLWESCRKAGSDRGFVSVTFSMFFVPRISIFRKLSQPPPIGLYCGYKSVADAVEVAVVVESHSADISESFLKQLTRSFLYYYGPVGGPQKFTAPSYKGLIQPRYHRIILKVLGQMISNFLPDIS